MSYCLGNVFEDKLHQMKPFYHLKTSREKIFLEHEHLNEISELSEKIKTFPLNMLGNKISIVFIIRESVDLLSPGPFFISFEILHTRNYCEIEGDVIKFN